MAAMEGRFIIDGKNKVTRAAERLWDNPRWRWLDEAEAAFSFAKRFGARLIVGVPGKRGKTPVWNDRVANLELCKKVSELCDRYDIRFAIHNHGPDMPLCFPTVPIP